MTTNSSDAAKHAAVARYDAWSRALVGNESPRDTFERRVRYERARDRALGMDWWREADDIEPQSTDDARRSVALDVERLPSDDPRKTSARCVGALKRLLVTHAMVASSSGGYKQGMHEVASMVLDVRVSATEYSRTGAAEDRWDDDSEDNRTVYGERVILEAGPRDFRFIEHDSFALFHALIGHNRKDGRFTLSMYYGDASRPSSPINGAFRRIEGALRVMDAKLANCLSDLGVEPQLYLLRWLRLGYGREFRRREVLTLWDAIFDRSADSGVNADVSSSRDIYEGVAVSILMSMKNDILEMTDFGEVMSRIQTVPQGIELSHVIARAKAFAVKGLLASHEEDGMKVFSSKNHYSTPPSLKKNRLVVPGIRGKSNSPRGDDVSSMHSLDSLSVEIAESANETETDSDDDDRLSERTMERPSVLAPPMVRSSPLSKATPLRVPPPTSSRTPTRRSSLLSNTSREIDDDDDENENENENDDSDNEDVTTDVVIVPMDGYHYYRHQLEKMDNPQHAFAKRGAPFTFDSERFVQDIVNLRKTGSGSFPSFDHGKGDPVENDILVDYKRHKIVLVEGNYLFLGEQPWARLLDENCFDETWYVNCPVNEATKRVIDRHIRTGKTKEAAELRAYSNDMVNAKLVDANKRFTDLMIPNAKKWSRNSSNSA